MISLGSNWVHYCVRLARILLNASNNSLCKRHVQCIKYKNCVDFHYLSLYSKDSRSVDYSTPCVLTS